MCVNNGDGEEEEEEHDDDGDDHGEEGDKRYGCTHRK